MANSMDGKAISPSSDLVTSRPANPPLSAANMPSDAPMQLAAELIRAIGRERPGGGGFGQRHLRGIAVNRRRRGIDDFFHFSLGSPGEQIPERLNVHAHHPFLVGHGGIRDRGLVEDGIYFSDPRRPIRHVAHVGRHDVAPKALQIFE